MPAGRPDFENAGPAGYFEAAGPAGRAEPGDMSEAAGLAGVAPGVLATIG